MSNLTIVTEVLLINFPHIWNDLDRSIKDIATRNFFKKTTKLEYFNLTLDVNIINI